jgi:sterol carrier protein 2
VEILAISLTTDKENTFSEKSLMNMAGYDMAKRAADEVYFKAGVCPM